MAMNPAVAYSRGTPKNMFLQDLSYGNHLRKFGELGFVTIGLKKLLKGKLENRGKLYVFTGYARNHAGNVYLMVDPVTGSLTKTDDIGRFLMVKPVKKANSKIDVIK